MLVAFFKGSHMAIKN